MAEEQVRITDPVTETALEAIQKALPDVVIASDVTGLHPWIQVDAARIHDVLQFMRDDEALQYDSLHLISSVDWPGKGDAVGEIEVVYHMVSYSRKPDPSYGRREGKNDPWVAIKVRLPRDKPEVPSVMDLWDGADWHERENFDLMGVIFTNREGLYRILLPDDWPGHPLRKDWVTPASYHGIPIVPPEGL